MRKVAFARERRGQQVTRSGSIPAPVGGWNTREALSQMGAKFATATNNLFGYATDVRVRQGWEDHVTGIGEQVESLMPYNGGGTKTFFCAADDSFYNVTSAGAVGGAVVGSLSNGRWEHFNFTNSAGDAYLCCFNGVDAPRYWNGSSWTTITGGSSPAIVGITTTTISNAFVFKRRVFLLTNNSLSLYYLPIDSVGGTVARTRLDGYFDKGGYLIAGATWSIDGGKGTDDFLVVVSSEGQLAIFEGTNPASSSSWSLKGLWNIGEPVSKRCFIKYGGDLLFLSVQGIIPLSRILLSSQEEGVDAAAFLSFNINTAMTEATMNYGANYGWDMEFYPGGNQLFLNVPVLEGASQEQYVMNTLTKSWWRFTTIEANCWAVFNGKMYFGGDGFVGKFGDGVFSDNTEDIKTDLKQAASYLGSRGRIKSVTALRPNILANGTPEVSVGFSVDYGDELPQQNLTFTPNTAGEWDTALWDAGFWGGDVAPYNDWQTVYATGTAFSLRMRTVSNGLDVRLAASDVLYEYGGVIG